MSWTLLNGDCIEQLRTLPDESVHCCITSPPYFGLRDYGIDGQYGLEPTPEEYVAKMVDVFREVKRVLRKDGTLWLNIGDSYSGGGRGCDTPKQQSNRGTKNMPKSIVPDGLKPKDLIGIPWRLAFALQADGWYLRSDIIWSKPNAIPESVTDRPTKSHEYLFLLAKSDRYYYDHEAIKEDAVNGDPAQPRGSVVTLSAGETRINGGRRKQDDVGKRTYDGFNARYTPVTKRNKRSVWEVSTQPFRGAHFATFPPKLIEPCILAGTSEKGCCPKCGRPWVRVIEKGEPVLNAWSANGAGQYDIETGGMKRTGIQKGSTLKHTVPTETVGWKPGCKCGLSEVAPCTVLDPFAGAGTTFFVAEQLGRNSIGIELNPEYCGIIEQRMESIEPSLVFA